jgi:hypothetical protein
MRADILRTARWYILLLLTPEVSQASLQNIVLAVSRCFTSKTSARAKQHGDQLIPLGALNGPATCCLFPLSARSATGSWSREVCYPATHRPHTRAVICI